MSNIHFAFYIYLVVLLVIGIYGHRKTKTIEDYVIGGRALTPSTTALSAGASDMSGWLLMGLPGAILISGPLESLLFLGLVIGAWVNWSYLAPRLRLQSENSNSTTISEFLAKQHDNHRSLRLVASLIIIFFFTLYTSAGFVAGAKLFTTILDIEYHFALIIGFLVIAGYTSIGGFLAVSWSDVLQALLIVLAITAVSILAIVNFDVSSTLTDRQSNPFGSNNRDDVGVIGAISLVAWGLGYFGQPHILARFMAIKDVEQLPRARSISITWMLASGIGAISIGIVGGFHFNHIDDPETIFIVLSQIVLHPIFAGIVIAAILAAIMSTVDSQLLIASTVLIRDVLTLEDSKASISRICVVLLALLASALATDPNNSVLDLVAYAWAGLGASFGPSILMSLYSFRTTPVAIICGILSGAGTVVIWRNLEGGIFELYEIVPGFIISTLIILIVSKITDKLR